MFDQDLIKLRNDFDNGILSEDDFIEHVNLVLSEIKEISDAEKAKAFDILADSVVSFLRIDEGMEDGIANIKSDWVHYVAEKSVEAAIGSDAWKFVNKTYEAG